MLEHCLYLWNEHNWTLDHDLTIEDEERIWEIRMDLFHIL